MHSNSRLENYKQINVQMADKCREYKSEIFQLRSENKQLNEELLLERERNNHLESFILDFYSTAKNLINPNLLPTQSENRPTSLVRPVFNELPPFNLSVIAEESIQGSLQSSHHDTYKDSKPSPPPCHIQSRRKNELVSPPLAIFQRSTESSRDTLSFNKENLTSQEYSFALNPVPCSTPFKPIVEDELTMTDQNASPQTHHAQISKSGDQKQLQPKGRVIPTNLTGVDNDNSPEAENNSYDTTTKSDPLSTINVNEDFTSTLNTSNTLRNRSVSVDSMIGIKQTKKKKNPRIKKQKDSSNDTQPQDASTENLNNIICTRTLRNAHRTGSLAEPKLNTKLRRPTKS